MFLTEWTLGAGADFAAVRALREAVRVREQGSLPAAEFDSVDAVAAHLYVRMQAGEPIAAGRMYPLPERDAVRIDRLVLAPQFRTGMYDDLALRVMLYKAQQMPFAAIEAVVEAAQQPLFARFGFAQADGLPGQGVLLRVPREGVVWESACKHETGEA